MENSEQKLKIGPLGESIVCRFLRKNGYSIIDRNYRKTWGEIDIIAEKGGTTHFFEVKAVSHEPNASQRRVIGPEENLHKQKLVRLERVIQSYLQEHGALQGRTWQLDAALVWIDAVNKTADVEILEGIGV